MNNMEILANAFKFIEDNLQNDIKTKDVADACYCSKSVLEKIFRCIGNISVREYMVKRRMTLAAKMLVSQEEINMLDIALTCGYSTHESFCRAFKGVWNCNPSEFKAKRESEAKKDYFELFPRLYPPIQDGGAYMSERRNVDISEMYDLFVQRKSCYFVCCDIKSLDLINKIAYKAGDLAILEAMNRMEKQAGKEDIVFRIGGDEFVMLTNREDKEYADDICRRIKESNGQSICFEGQNIPLDLHVSATKFEGGSIRYRDLYEQLHMAILDSK